MAQEPDFVRIVVTRELGRVTFAAHGDVSEEPLAFVDRLSRFLSAVQNLVGEAPVDSVVRIHYPISSRGTAQAAVTIVETESDDAYTQRLQELVIKRREVTSADNSRRQVEDDQFQREINRVLSQLPVRTNATRFISTKLDPQRDPKV